MERTYRSPALLSRRRVLLVKICAVGNRISPVAPGQGNGGAINYSSIFRVNDLTAANTRALSFPWNRRNKIAVGRRDYRFYRRGHFCCVRGTTPLRLFSRLGFLFTLSTLTSAIVSGDMIKKISFLPHICNYIIHRSARLRPVQCCPLIAGLNHLANNASIRGNRRARRWQCRERVAHRGTKEAPYNQSKQSPLRTCRTHTRKVDH